MSSSPTGSGGPAAGSPDQAAAGGASVSVPPQRPTPPAGGSRTVTARPIQSVQAPIGPEDRSLGELFAIVTRNMSVLVHQEVELAKAELQGTTKRIGQGAGAFAGAGLFAHTAFLMLTVAAAFGLAGLGLPLGVGFLIVAVAYLLIAGILGLLGRRNLQKVTPPERSIESIKTDIEMAKRPTRVPAPPTRPRGPADTA